MLQRLRAEFFPAQDSFDRGLGVTTAGSVSLRRLRIRSVHKSAGVRYQPVDPEIFRQAMQYIPKDRIFIDLGCGKGRGLILAHQAGFRRLIGVEFSSKLARIASRNLAHLKITAQIVEQDAATFSFPRKPSVIFLYNPFGPEVLREVIPQMYGYILYVNPQHPEEFASFSLLHKEPTFMVFFR
jgi:SAM-dependent methyltransferase